MPLDKQRYPYNWNERAKAHKEQAGWTCEVCGAKQGEERWDNVNHRFYTVWLAAAHLNHDPENPKALMTKKRNVIRGKTYPWGPMGETRVWETQYHIE